MDYIFLVFGVNHNIRHFFKLFRLFKVYRSVELIKIIRAHSNIKVPLFTIGILFFLFILFAHFMASIYIFIGKREVGHARRFDHKTMFDDVTNRDFVNLPPATELSPFDLYVSIRLFEFRNNGSCYVRRYYSICTFRTTFHFHRHVHRKNFPGFSLRRSSIVLKFHPFVLFESCIEIKPDN